MSTHNPNATASLENLYRIFTVPEAPDSTLGTIDREISDNLAGFLRDRIVTREKDLADIEADFASATIPDSPHFVSDYTDFVLDKLVAHSVHTAAPGFVGHMAAPLPYFMLPISRIMLALNQNLVKIETSKAFTPLERQVLGMLHKLIYGQSDDFYAAKLHNSNDALGAFCSGGTIANITALWTARNRLFPAKGEFGGIAKEGLFRALRHAGYEGLAILASQRAHYSLGKAVDVLGIGRDQLIAIDTDQHNRVNLEQLREQHRQLSERKIKVIAIVGMAGTTETGSVDPLDQLADMAAEFGCHFHVDGAWGGPTLFSEKYRPILSGIERADSVTIDAHKQLYVPMGAGMVLFKDPTSLATIEHHAEYILRKGSKDLGSHTLEGSRPGMAMLVHAAFHIIGRKGYELLIDQNIEKTKAFAELIRSNDQLQLMAEPELNILTYRYAPTEIQQQLENLPRELQQQVNAVLDSVTKKIQKKQRADGKTFVSRTRFSQYRYHQDPVTVFRTVLANPLTTVDTLQEVLEEQQELAKSELVAAEMAELSRLLANHNSQQQAHG